MPRGAARSPGAVGFQLIIMWMTAFYRIPHVWKLLHLASLVAVAVAPASLITPAAYHRIVEQGEDSEMLHHITARAAAVARWRFLPSECVAISIWFAG